MKKTIRRIETLPNLVKRTKVAAYARVSSGKDAMLHSLAAQINYYKKHIKSNNEWEFVGVYADEALSGTKESRNEFQMLLTACRNGGVDLIITKSISRFARNTTTLLETVRELKSLNVDVYFEEQNIHSISGEGEMILTFLAVFAQEEARSTSENMKWRIRKDFEEGVIWGGKSCLGYKLENKKLTVVPKEAKIVRFIFKLYIDGNGDEMICKILEKQGIPPYKGKRWYHSTVINVLNNYNYTGDLILQKTFRENYLTKKKKINRGEHDKYIVKGSHEPIIPMKTFLKAQEIRKTRLQKISKRTASKKYAFSGMMKCGICGRGFTHKTTPYKEIWKCSFSIKRGVKECSSKQVSNDVLIEASNHILNIDRFNEDYFREQVDYIEVMPETTLLFHMKDKSIVSYQWKRKSRSDSWTAEMREKARQRELIRLKGVDLDG